jgi:hypothetical protein
MTLRRMFLKLCCSQSLTSGRIARSRSAVPEGLHMEFPAVRVVLTVWMPLTHIG